MPRMPLAERRTLLVDAAIAIIAESGINAATTRAIAARAGMPLASFHYAFESHSALMYEVADRIQIVDAEEILTVEIPPGVPLEQLVAGAFNQFLDVLVQGPHRHHAVMELAFWALRTEGQQEVAGKLYASAQQALERLVERFLAVGGVEVTTPVADIARHALMVSDTIAVQFLMTRDAEAIRRVIPALASGFSAYMR